MAQKDGGATAPYRPLSLNLNPPTTWCNGVAPGGVVPVPAGAFPTATLSSTGFGSCVGLVMYSPSNHQGAVAHFPGSLGATQYALTVQNDVAQILQDVCPAPVQLDWKVWIFGGESLIASGQDSGAISQTKALIDLVRNAVRAHLVPQGGGQAHLLPGAEEETQSDSYVGHTGVTLTLANGTVEWQAPKGATARTRERRGSGSTF